MNPASWSALAAGEQDKARVLQPGCTACPRQASARAHVARTVCGIGVGAAPAHTTTTAGQLAAQDGPATLEEADTWRMMGTRLCDW